MRNYLHYLFLLFFHFPILSQEINFKENAVLPAMTENANAYLAHQSIKIDIISQKSMNILTQRVVTIYNESGLRHAQAAESYSKNYKIKNIEAVVYDKSGKEIKKFKRKDFIDNSQNDGFSILNDDRILSIDYVPTQYPFTLIFNSEIQTSNTAFIPNFRPIEGYYISIGNTEYEINYPGDVGFRYLENNMDFCPIEISKSEFQLRYKVQNVPALRGEDYAAYTDLFLPRVYVAINKFHLEGVDGYASNWKEFGTWLDELMKDTKKLPEETIHKIKTWVGDEKDPIKKIKLVQEYVQSKTRYVSIQLGIGGWKPMLASDVDRLGYGDCKALTNYTKALLEAVDIPSYYTIVYSNSQKISLNQDFTSVQGNHAILAIPVNNELKWLECTSQTLPFDYQGDSTDDRLALIIKPDGGELVRTKVYQPKDNAQISKGSYVLDINGGLSGEVTIKSSGFQYGDKYSIEKQSEADKKDFYKRYFSNINNLVIQKMRFENNRDAVVFTENITLESNQYATKNGNRLMVPINAFNKFSSSPNRYKKRVTPFVIARGFEDQDEIVVTLPEGCTIEAIPENTNMTSKFGQYSAQYELKGNQLHFKRIFTSNEGSFTKEDYEEFRKFREQVTRNDNAKMVLLIKQ